MPFAIELSKTQQGGVRCSYVPQAVQQITLLDSVEAIWVQSPEAVGFQA